jgi:hypothetical protein
MKHFAIGTLVAGALAMAGGDVGHAVTQQASSQSLGRVRIIRAVTADGKPLPAGTYEVRLTAEQAKPDVVGQDPSLERWVEFVQAGQVRGREVVTIVPEAEIGQVAEGRPPRAGASKVEVLKGDDYLRVWINRGGTHYLIHLPV